MKRLFQFCSLEIYVHATDNNSWLMKKRFSMNKKFALSTFIVCCPLSSMQAMIVKKACRLSNDKFYNGPRIAYHHTGDNLIAIDFGPVIDGISGCYIIFGYPARQKYELYEQLYQQQEATKNNQ